MYDMQISSQQLEVISSEKHGEAQCVQGIEENPAQFDNTSTPKVRLDSEC